MIPRVQSSLRTFQMCPSQESPWQGIGGQGPASSGGPALPLSTFPSGASTRVQGWMFTLGRQAPGGGEKVTQSKPALFVWLVEGKRLWHTLTGTSAKRKHIHPGD